MTLESVQSPSTALRVMPAMEAGLADHIWSLEELVKSMQGEEKAIAVLQFDFPDLALDRAPRRAP